MNDSAVMIRNRMIGNYSFTSYRWKIYVRYIAVCKSLAEVACCRRGVATASASQISTVFCRLPTEGIAQQKKLTFSAPPRHKKSLSKSGVGNSLPYNIAR